MVEINVDPDEVCLVGHSLLSIQVDSDGDEQAVSSSSSSSSSDEELHDAAPSAHMRSAQSGPGKYFYSCILTIVLHF